MKWNYITKPIASAGIFVAFVVIFSFAYASWTTINVSDAGANMPLTSSMMQGVINNLEDLQSRLTSLSNKFTSGYMVGYAYSNNVTNSTISTNIPWDDTIPQITEWDEILTATITPKSATDLLEVEAVVHYSETINSSDYFILAAFKDSTTNAFATAASNTSAVNCSPASGYSYICQAVLKTVIPAGTTSPTTIRIRAGINTGSAQINGSSGRKLGGTLTSFLWVKEIAQ